MSDINLNYAACLKEANYIGYTHYVNVCNGTQFDVAWGGGDWLGNIALGVFVLVFMSALLGGMGLVAYFVYQSWRSSR